MFSDKYFSWNLCILKSDCPPVRGIGVFQEVVFLYEQSHNTTSCRKISKKNLISVNADKDMAKFHLLVNVHCTIH